MGRRASRTVVPPVVAVTVLFLLALVPTATAGGGTFATAEAVNNNDLPVTKSGTLSTSETWYKVEAYYGDRIIFDYDVSCNTWWPLIDTCEGQIKIFDENQNEIFSRNLYDGDGNGQESTTVTERRHHRRSEDRHLPRRNAVDLRSAQGHRHRW